jgi:hypothetical protein
MKIMNLIIPISLSANQVEKELIVPKWGFLGARQPKPITSLFNIKRARNVLRQTKGILNEMARGYFRLI